MTPASSPDPNAPTLLIDGTIYAGWTSITVERSLERMSSHFRIGVTERWPGLSQTWQIKPFQPCVLKIGDDVELTGYVDDYRADFNANNHNVTISGRSKTEDLTDSTPDIKSGQFKGYTLESIARAIGKLYSIDVVVQTDASQMFPDATLQRCETAFSFLERLARLAGVLLTDDEMGNLVLTTTGTIRAAGGLVQGQNILHGNCNLSGARRFSSYIVKGQTAIGSAAGQSLSLAGFGGIPGGASAAPAPVQTSQRAEAVDPNVPRYRPKVSLAEAQLDQAGMQRRATWERNYAFGRGTELEIGVHGFRQADGKLWTINRLISVTAPFLQADQDLLIVGTTMTLDAQGRTTTLKLGPVEGYTPDPGQVKQHCRKNKKGKSALDLTGFGGQ